MSDTSIIPCGESFYEGSRSISCSLSSRLNKEKNIPTTFKKSSKLSCENDSLPESRNDYSVKTQTSVSMSSASVIDDMKKDSLLLTELLDSSDDEWANTGIRDNNGQQKMSISPATATLNSSVSRAHSVASTPNTCSQRPIPVLSTKVKPGATQSNNLNSSFNSPNRINTIPNNGNDGEPTDRIK